MTPAKLFNRAELEAELKEVQFIQAQICSKSNQRCARTKDS